VALILGDSYHPGGLDLTRRLARALGLRPGDRVLDVASGPGTTAFLLASEFGVVVDGVDLGDLTVAKANATAASEGIADRVRFHLGDAERIPLPDASVDAVVCECAFCTFPDKQTAAAEMARVLKPGGCVGITDVALEPTRLDAELQSLAGWVSCLADARPVQQYVEILDGAGLTVRHTESHDDALARMVEQIDARLLAFRMAKCRRWPTSTSTWPASAPRTRRAPSATASRATRYWWPRRRARRVRGRWARARYATRRRVPARSTTRPNGRASRRRSDRRRRGPWCGG
jgi:arsenite methyltransferase